jgi:hypothetical protein
MINMITYLFPFLVMVKAGHDPQSKTDVASKIFIGVISGNGKAGVMPISLQSKLA